MSSRALRRAQKELEERQRQETLAQSGEGEESEEEVAPAAKPKASLFAMLGDAGDENEDDDEEPEEEDTAQSGGVESIEDVLPAPKPSKKSKKKKKKGKGKAKSTEPEKPKLPSQAQSDMDEIDRALLALNLSPQIQGDQTTGEATMANNEELRQLYSVLAVDTQHLQSSNEMRKLFGRAALQDNDVVHQVPRQRPGPGQRTTGAAPSRGLRRNVFVKAKDEWPQTNLGGLGMEKVGQRGDGSVEYRYVHNTLYQRVQNDFERCVASMDPEQILRLHRDHPYHISTLLQVSEIAKQQRDHAAAGDMLERALFAFGRASNSTFITHLAEGKARLDFRRPENREFWLAGWRYIATLGIRATWRTAFEWAKLLLSLAPEEDPYCLRLLIDQLALRGREPQSLVNLVDSDHLQRSWKIPPNLAFSVALAHDRMKNPEKARSTLRLAIKEYPWIAARLCKELEISPIPKSVWGKEPVSDYHEILCQLYVPKAKDLWNTPEATALLVEVLYSIEEPLGGGEEPYWLAHIDELNLARHIILLDDKPLLSLLDNKVKSKYTSVSDPLPPEDSVSSYSLSGVGAQQDSALDETQLLIELERLRIYFSNIEVGRNINENTTQEDIIRMLHDAGTSIEEFGRNTERVQVLRAQLNRLGLQVVFDGEGDAAAERDVQANQDTASDSDA